MSGAPSSPYAADSLAANQGGQLTDAQRQLYRSDDRSTRRTELYLAVGAIVIAVLLITSTGPAPNAAFRPVVAALCVVAAVILVVRATLSPDSLSRDLGAGTVVSIDGAVLRSIRQGQRTEWFQLQVAGQRFDVPRSVYNAAPEAGYVRVYYLPRSRKVVNLEVLPNKAVPAGLAADPQALAQVAFAGLKTHDPTQRAEAMAEMAALGQSFQAGTTAAATPPPAAAGAPPLAEAIVGSWRSGPIGVTFAADGSMTTKLPGGHDQAGR
ncbi:MAG TPA: hypothetical protein VKR24_10320, partial [Candidatus Limnocylindrales bacterium]|nr:hypothetical protein [Candidatus Limnocylindrales bacterium]